MKKFIFTLIIVFSININFIYSYNETYNEQNIDLIESYINSLKSQIFLFVDKYDINEKKIDNNITELNNLLLALNNIEGKDYTTEENNKIINIILDKLKENKDIIKDILKIEKDNYEKNYNQKKALYERIGKSINIQLNTIIKKYYNIYEKKKELTKIDNEIIKILKNLSDESLKLKNFNTIEFSSTDEMKYSFARILKNIKNESVNLKNLRN
jgi:hypothetical protein